MLNKVYLLWRKMMVTIAILGVCLATAAVGLGLYTLSYSMTALPSASAYEFIIYGYWTGAIILIYGAIIGFLLFGIGRLLIKYKIVWGLHSGDIPVEFHLSWLKRVVLLWIPPDWGEVKAEVAYRYGEESGWQHASVAEWKESIGLEIPIKLGRSVNVKGARDGLLITVFKMDSSGQIFTIHPDRQPLPNQFEYRIRLIRNADNKLIHEHRDLFENKIISDG